MNFRKKSLSLAVIASLGLASFSMADDSLFGSSDDDLFGSNGDDLFGGEDSGFIAEISEEDDSSLADELLEQSNGLSWSGRFNWSSEGSAFYHELSSAQLAMMGGAIASSGSQQVSSSLSGNLKLDARPNADYRVLLSLDYAATAAETTFNLREAFADFDWQDRLYIRAGQQSLHWGVGYFFSPADTLSSESIDASNPDNERKGALAVRTHLPLGTSNLYAYVLPNEAEANLSLALKAEGLLMGQEWGVGLIRHASGKGNLVVTSSAPFEFGDLFGEYVATLGERTIGVDAEGNLSQREDDIQHQMTVGYRGTKDFNDWFKLSFASQYQYNGLGYDHALWVDNPMIWATAVAGQALPSQLGQQQLALTFSWTELLKTPVSYNTLVLHSLSDQSTLWSNTLSVSPIDYVGLSLSTQSMRGELASEYAGLGNADRVSIKLNIGNQSF